MFTASCELASRIRKRYSDTTALNLLANDVKHHFIEQKQIKLQKKALSSREWSMTYLPLQIHHPSSAFYYPSSFSSEASSGLQQAPCSPAGLQPNNTDTSIDYPWVFSDAASWKV